jgi:hypothetical protein
LEVRHRLPLPPVKAAFDLHHENEFEFSFLGDLALNRWEDVLQSPNISDIRKALNNPAIVPLYYPKWKSSPKERLLRCRDTLRFFFQC